MTKTITILILMLSFAYSTEGLASMDTVESTKGLQNPENNNSFMDEDNKMEDENKKESIENEAVEE